jgi:hypothetical protein
MTAEKSLEVLDVVLNHPGLGGGVMTASPASVLADSKVARLQRALEDVRFSLERGNWQAALATTRAALTHDKTTKP